ncbi:MAG: 1-deoxy-D-xylulose-5-phosphate synthase N-terminal domain-containing protein [Enterocloster clostridioformis]
MRWWAVRSKTGDTVIMILEQINGPEELKALPPEDLKILAQEIRTFLIEKISHTGGHLASNLEAWWN